MKNSETDPESKQKTARLIGVYATIPFALAVPPVIGWFIGEYLDDWFQTTPWIAYILIFLGMIAGIEEVYRLVKRFENDF